MKNKEKKKKKKEPPMQTISSRYIRWKMKIYTRKSAGWYVEFPRCRCEHLAAGSVSLY